MTLTEFILARIAEDEGEARFGLAHPYDARYDVGSYDPARVLAECEAKRRQIDHLIRFMEGDYAPWNAEQLEIMASVYAGHDEYDESWKP